MTFIERKMLSGSVVLSCDELLTRDIVKIRSRKDRHTHTMSNHISDRELEQAIK